MQGLVAGPRSRGKALVIRLLPTVNITRLLDPITRRLLPSFIYLFMHLFIYLFIYLFINVN